MLLLKRVFRQFNPKIINPRLNQFYGNSIAKLAWAPRLPQRKMAAEELKILFSGKLKSKFSAAKTSALVEQYKENKEIRDSKLTN